MHQSTGNRPVQVWTVDDIAGALVAAGRTLRAEAAVAAAAPARLCLRDSCQHGHDGTWTRPTTPRPVYGAHRRGGRQ